ncbi:trypsin [Dictyocaulus viviparus]|uniref:Trypsin n=1 Tax=Dictyocaulus viviparus TaxID=29172 RepID=A0A0D8Y5T4_DICVI|nr:trypsin [Dictyocaulus viviparus]
MYRIDDERRLMKVMVGGICRKNDEKNDCSDAETGKWFGVKNAFYAPFFEHGCSGTYDIAFIELNENVPDDVHHICLPHLHDADELDDSSIRLFSSGFGSDQLNENVPDDVHHICLPHLHDADELDDSSIRLFSSGFGSDRVKMPDDECDERENRKPDTFCTYERAEKDVCSGDSGSGITTSLNGRHYLIGLVSYGSNCEDLIEGFSPGAQVHTNLAFYTADIDVFLDMMVEDRRKMWMEVEKAI